MTKNDVLFDELNVNKKTGYIYSIQTDREKSQAIKPQCDLTLGA